MENPQNANQQERDIEPGSAVTADELQRRQRGSLPSFLFITFLFFMLTNRNEDDLFVRAQYEDIVRALGYQLSNYSAWLNGTATNFTLVRGSNLFCAYVPNCYLSQPERDVFMERLVSEILPVPHQPDPFFGSYYSNASGWFHGDVRYYNLSSIPYDTNVTWKPIADHLMENTNLSAIPERLGNWNWSATDTIGIRVLDMMTTVSNVSESMAIFQVLCSLIYPALRVSKIVFRAGLNCPTLQSRIQYCWSSMVSTSRKMVHSTHLLKRRGVSRDLTTVDNF
jgi:hypothetical protein